MTGLKINLEDLESELEDDDPARMCDEGLRLGGLMVSAEGLTTSMGHRYGLSPEDVVVSETEFLGQGSSGSVRRAVHRSTGKVLALKEIKVTSHAHMQEIRRELETLNHDGNHSPYLVDFYGAFRHEGSVVIAMECMDGSLDNVPKPLPEEVLVSVTRSIVRGLWYLHRNMHLIHRDLKPSNILYSADGRIKISDFGVSSSLECTRADAHSFVGTVTYMSPERLKGDSYSYSADIWSFGLVVTELVLGGCPFMERLARNNTSPEACFWILLQHLGSDRPVLVLPSSLDPCTAEFIAMCIQKDPQKRPTCDELLQHPFLSKGDEENDKQIIRQWIATLKSTSNENPCSRERHDASATIQNGETPLNLDDELNKLLQ